MVPSANKNIIIIYNDRLQFKQTLSSASHLSFKKNMIFTHIVSTLIEDLNCLLRERERERERERKRERIACFVLT